MEQLIILLVVGLGSAISSYIQNKKKREAQRRGEPPLPNVPPIAPWPKTTGDWQADLRRLLQGENPPPRVPPVRPAPPASSSLPKNIQVISTERSEGDVSFASPLRQSRRAYDRAAQLADRVESRLNAVDRQTTTHARSSASKANVTNKAVLQRWRRDRRSLREAFLASLIFSRPVALREPQ